MAQIIILCDQFYEIRKLLTKKKYIDHRGNGRGNFNNEYQRKRQRKFQQIQLFKTDERFKEFFTWVFSIQDRLKITNIEFAKLLNVTPQTISSWKQYDGPNGGQFPSRGAFNRLIKLEIACQIEINIKKRRVPLKDKGLPPVKIKIPRARIRLKASSYY